MTSGALSNMGYQHVYTVDALPPDSSGLHKFRVVKHTKHLVQKNLPLSEEGAYEVVKNPERGSILCDCYAGLMGKQCRHIEMVLIAEDASNLNTGKFFDFERKKWIPSS